MSAQSGSRTIGHKREDVHNAIMRGQGNSVLLQESPEGRSSFGDDTSILFGQKRSNIMYTALKNGFILELERIGRLSLPSRLQACTSFEVQRALGKDALSEADFLAMLSPAAAPFLEAAAKRAHAETLRFFGRTVQIFTPLYLANYCTNRCVYCGFSTRRDIARRMLTLDEVDAEARCIAATGLRKILALTGDDPKRTGAAYLADCLRILARHFSSVGIEVPSMTVDEYAMQAEAGADSMTMFQETYDCSRYVHLHPGGPKSNFNFRLDAPERALLGGMRAVNLGPLLGLADWRTDVFTVGMHARWLMRRYPHAEISISLPRMRPHTEGGEVEFIPEVVDDTAFVQALVALRCFLPQAGITMSSREPAWLRDRLIHIGVTRVSAGVSTAVGGHAASARNATVTQDKPQFDIADDRSVDEMTRDLAAQGYQPVFADWLLAGNGARTLTGGVAAAVALQTGTTNGAVQTGQSGRAE